jgi:hypothetical protein
LKWEEERNRDLGSGAGRDLWPSCGVTLARERERRWRVASSDERERRAVSNFEQPACRCTLTGGAINEVGYTPVTTCWAILLTGLKEKGPHFNLDHEIDGLAALTRIEVLTFRIYFIFMILKIILKIIE